MNTLNYKNIYRKYFKIFEFILKSNNFFRPNNRLNGFCILTDPNKADTLYTMEYPTEELGEEEGGKYDIYADLINDRFNPYYSYFDNFNDIEYSNHLKFDSEFSDEIWKVILEVEKYNPYMIERFTDYIHNDILSFIPYLTFSTKSDKLTDLKIDAYINGAMPCGWYGKYPEGELVVYIPSSES